MAASGPPAIDVNSAKTVPERPVRKHRRRPPRAPVAPPVVPGLVQSRETRRAAREAARMAREAAHNVAHTQACREVFGHKSDTVYLLHDHHLGIVVMPHYPPRSPVLSPNNTRGGVGPPSDGTKHHPYRLFSPYVASTVGIELCAALPTHWVFFNTTLCERKAKAAKKDFLSF